MGRSSGWWAGPMLALGLSAPGAALALTIDFGSGTGSDIVNESDLAVLSFAGPLSSSVPSPLSGSASGAGLSVGFSVSNPAGSILSWNSSAGFGISDGATQVAGVTIQVNVVPEPGTALLLMMGLAGISLASRRRD